MTPLTCQTSQAPAAPPSAPLRLPMTELELLLLRSGNAADQISAPSSMTMHLKDLSRARSQGTFSSQRRKYLYCSRGSASMERCMCHEGHVEYTLGTRLPRGLTPQIGPALQAAGVLIQHRRHNICKRYRNQQETFPCKRGHLSSSSWIKAPLWFRSPADLMPPSACFIFVAVI